MIAARLVSLTLTGDQLAEIQLALVERAGDIDRKMKDPLTPPPTLPFWRSKRASLTEVILLVAKT